MQDDKIKDLLAGTQLKAGENLKFRIMQQLETEKALAPKKRISTHPVLKNMFSIFGTMYGLIALIALLLYLSSGAQVITSSTFYLPVIFIVSVCSLYWGISEYDDRRRHRHNTK